jgi:phospholipid/cholesterol/gamma-HCH transport system permease protein
MSARAVAAAGSVARASAELGAVRDGVAVLTLGGEWTIAARLPASAETLRTLDAATGLERLAFDASGVTGWDSGLASFLTAVVGHCRGRGVEVDPGGLPGGLKGLLHLAFAVPERKGARRGEDRSSFLERVGEDWLGLVRSTGEIMTFLGEVVLAFGRMLKGRACFRRSELWVLIQQSGADALPIVSVVTFLVGLILAYIGSAQLAQFGAKIYVADLGGLAMVIQMGALVTAIVLAVRTGAAFAAQIGTMQVNEEVDALRTLGISPMDFLVLPRMMALVLMTPLLAMYADLMGILGGAFVAVTIEGIGVIEYANRTREAIQLHHAAQGIINAAIYGAIVAVSGCLRGMQCGRSASAVGLATTSAVVTSIVFIVIAAAVMTVVFQALGW